MNLLRITASLSLTVLLAACSRSEAPKPADLPSVEELATDPVATNPSPELEAVAQSRGWRILRLFA